MNILKIVASNTSSQIISRVISSGTGFFITILIARSFGLSGYSDLAKITALVSLFYLGIDLGANAIFLQLEKEEQHFQHFLSFRLLLALCIFLVVMALIIFLPYNPFTTSGYSPLVKIGIIFFSLSFFSRSIVLSAGAIFQQKLTYQLATKASAVGSLLTLGLVAIFVLFHFSILWIIGAYVVGGFAEAVLSLVFVKEKFSLLFPSREFVRKVFFATLPITVLLFLNLIYFRVDMILLTFFKKAYDVGIYDFAFKFFDFLIALPLFLSNSLYPIL